PKYKTVGSSGSPVHAEQISVICKHEERKNHETQHCSASGTKARARACIKKFSEKNIFDSVEEYLIRGKIAPIERKIYRKANIATFSKHVININLVL
ncbi:10969_t:CDS:2, partial [Acaulospora colombiana]